MDRRRLMTFVAVLLSSGLAACDDTRRADPSPTIVASSSPTKGTSRARKGGMDVTFLVTADTHFGHGVDDKDPASKRPTSEPQGIEEAHLRAIAAMNSIEGRSFPENVGGTVGKPLGLLVAGDLTDSSHPAEWARFVAYYGGDGTDGLLRYPVFETWGNHDKFHGWYVRKRIEERHGHVRYTIDWQDLHIVSLGEAPDDDDLVWLEQDLKGVGREVGIVIFMHYPLDGPFSLNNWFGRGDYRDKLADKLRHHHVLGIFHGHYHASTRYRWRGYDVYNVGSPKHGYDSFAAVRVTDDRMVVASWNYGVGGWGWVHEKALKW